MKLYIKYMVTNHCKMEVKAELQRLGLHFIVVDLGEVEIMEELTVEQRLQLKSALTNVGFELMDDKRAILIERIIGVIIEMVHNTTEINNLNFSDYLSEKLNHHYTYLSNIFSEVKGITIQQFIIIHKVERVKELLMYDELNLTEISYLLNYSSVAHLSNQFKKITGLSPSQFKLLKDKKRIPREEIGNSPVDFSEKTDQ
jgi:AraC-like DNA-binding protein